IDQAGLLQVRHHVAHRSWRQRHRNDARQIARADRLAGGEIALDHLAENLARALGELREPGLIGAAGDVVGGHRALIYHSAAAMEREPARGTTRSKSISFRTEPKSSRCSTAPITSAMWASGRKPSA